MRLALTMTSQAACGLAILAACSAEAAAQNTSSVSSPVVKAGDRGAEYRFGWVPDAQNGAASFAHRLDYGFSLNARQSLKVIAAFRDRPGDDLNFRSIGAEYLI